MNELKLLATILSNLHISTYDNPEITKLWNLEGPIKDCIADFGSLKAKLESKKKGWLSTFVGLQWPFDEKGTMEYLLQVERLKSHFLLALAVDQQARAKAIEKHVQDITGGIKDLKMDTAV